MCGECARTANDSKKRGRGWVDGGGGVGQRTPVHSTNRGGKGLRRRNCNSARYASNRRSINQRAAPQRLEYKKNTRTGQLEARKRECNRETRKWKTSKKSRQVRKRRRKEGRNIAGVDWEQGPGREEFNSKRCRLPSTAPRARPPC